MEVEVVQKLYDQGKIAEAMEAVWGEVMEARKADNPDIGKLKVIRAWCHWRRQEWEDAKQWLREAEEAGGAELQTKRLRAYFAAYRDKDDQTLRRLIQELGDDVGVQNALVIRARDEDSTLSHAEISRIVFNFSGGGVEMANLNHNGARFFLAKARDDGDLSSAVGMLDRALSLYGEDKNWHHRAAANFWKSHAFQRLGQKDDALETAVESMSLWEKAVELDSENQGFMRNLESARARATELR